MNIFKLNFATIILLSFLTVAPAQILKPSEIIYSRLPNNINAPPNGANSPTIWAVGQDGSNDRLITNGTAPRISDDGRFLLFKRFTRAPSFFLPFGGYADYVVRELATGQETLIISNNFDQGSYGHFFSPESNQGNYEIIADDSCFMYKFNRNGTNLFRFPWLNAIYCGDDFPVLRRGGDQLIAFHNLANDPAAGLYTVAINGLNRQKIPNTVCGDMNPAWSNDSQFLAFGTLFVACDGNSDTAYPYFVKNLYKIKSDGTSRQQLTNFSAGDCRQSNVNCMTYGMVWTEDNSKIITAGRINSVPGLFAFNTDGNAGFSQIPISAGNAPDFVGGIVPPRVERNVVSMGGGVATNGNYTLVSTIGEPIAGQTSIGGAFSFESGFWAISGEIRRSPFDFDGDGKTDIGIFRPGPAEWWYRRSGDGQVPAFQFGATTDKITVGDWTGDGKADVSFWRPSSGFWFVLRSEDSSFFAFPFGTNGDIPVPADYDGDGKTDAAVFRPSSTTWFIIRSTDGGSIITQFGSAGDIPVPADYDGDGKADIAIWRPNAAGGGQWWMTRSTAGPLALQFGNASDRPVPADYTGDGKADIAFFRPGNGNWFILRSEDSSFYSFPFGGAGDIPSPGDYDGDGKIDPAVFRPSSTTWFILGSTSGTIIQQFGSAGDIPLPSA